ncbi:hypothetical protein BJ741DRAFT_590279 [Chytriomyces cf. hyalinus JEL632]|nr:hypothetical protein BJ741DRAFT_590279 [Chytriomyces cf. hyalinus JEL632]
MQTKSLLTTIATASVTATASAALPPSSASDMACVPVPQQSQCSSFPVRHINLTAMSLQTLSANVQPFSSATEWSAYLESLQTSETALDAHLKSVFGCKSHEDMHMDPSAITSQLCLAARGSSVMCVNDAVDDTPHFLDQKNVNLQAAPGELGNTGPSSTGGLSTGAIVGIVIGCVAAGIAIVFGLIALLRKPSSKVKRSESDHLIPNRAPFSTLASYNNRGGVPTDYSPLTEGIDMKERAPKAGPKLLGRQSVVLEYTASQPDELSVKVGDILILQEYKQDGWGEGVLERSGARGVFPLVCVGIVERPATA